MTTRPPSYKFAFEINKEHPYNTEGFTHDEAAMALIRAQASDPRGVYSMGDSGYYFKDSVSGNTYMIRWQE